MANDVNSINSIDFLHPENFTKEQLQLILIERGVLKTSHNMDRTALIELFTTALKPLPQRVYKETRRGLLMTSLQKKKGLESGDDISNEINAKQAKLDTNSVSITNDKKNLKRGHERADETKTSTESRKKHKSVTWP